MLNPIFLLSIVFASSCISQEHTGKAPTASPKPLFVGFVYFHSIFPKHWYNRNIAGSAESLDSSEIDRSKKTLNIAIKKYPRTVLQKNLKKVYFLKSLYFYSVNYGGTYWKDTLYIANSGERLGYTVSFVEKTIHHEFSSILMEHYPRFFNKKEWIKFNHVDFKYGSGGQKEIKEGKDSEEINSELNEKGFLTEYGMSSLENDLNEIAQNLFVPEAGFWDAVNKYPKLKHKVDLAIIFYGKIDPIFTEAYFKEFMK